MNINQNYKVKKSGLGFITTLTLILIVLKAFNLISISWLWVLSPIWISLAIVGIAFMVILVVARIKSGHW